MGRDREQLRAARERAKAPERILTEVIAPKLASSPLEVEVEVALGDDAWCLTLSASGCSVRAGASTAPAMIIALSPADFEDLVLGALDPQQALISGRISVAGDASAIAALFPLFARAATNAAFAS